MKLSEIETTCPPSLDVFAPNEYRHQWCASIVFAALALDGNAYDLMTAADRNEEAPVRGRQFRRSDHRKPLMDRYALLQQVGTGKALDLGQGLAQEAKALLILRDEIVHYKTEWMSAPAVSVKMESLLNGRFELSRYRTSEVFFPDRCVSASSAMWATETARSFMRTFAESTGWRANV